MPWPGGHRPLEQRPPSGMEPWCVGSIARRHLLPPWHGPGRRTVLAGKSPASHFWKQLRRGGALQDPSAFPSISPQAASRAKSRPSEGTTGLCRDGRCPWAGPGPRTVQRCQPNQGLGTYLIWARASMACCRTAVCRWSTGSSSTSACRTQPGWDLVAAGTRRQGWWRPSVPSPAPAPSTALLQGCSATPASPQAAQCLSAHAGPCPPPAWAPCVLTVCRRLATCPLPQSSRGSPHLDVLCHLKSVVELLQFLCEALISGILAQGGDGLQEPNLLSLLLGSRGAETQTGSVRRGQQDWSTGAAVLCRSPGVQPRPASSPQQPWQQSRWPRQETQALLPWKWL